MLTTLVAIHLLESFGADANFDNKTVSAADRQAIAALVADLPFFHAPISQGFGTDEGDDLMLSSTTTDTQKV